MKVYLDVCCLNRPFDDQSQDRIRLEAEAILSILNRCQTEDWNLTGSEVIDIEISKIPDDERQMEVSILASISHSKVIVNEEIEKRAMEISGLKFSAFDALHLACAEYSKADVMLTVDDNLMRKALENINFLKIKVENPVKWLMEVI